MKKLFLAIFVLLSFLATILLNKPSSAWVDPNLAILNQIKNADAANSANVTRLRKSDFEKENSAQEIEEEEVVAAPVKEKKKKAEATKPAAKSNIVARGYKGDPNEALLRKLGLLEDEDNTKLNAISTSSGRGEIRASTWFSTTDDGQRLTISFTKRPSYKEDKQTGRLKLYFAAPVSYTPPAIPQKFSKSFLEFSKTSGDNSNLVLELKTGSMYDIKISNHREKIYIDAIDNEKIAQREARKTVVIDALAEQEQKRIDAIRKEEEARLAAIKAEEERAAKAAAEAEIARAEAEAREKEREKAMLEASGIPQIDIEKLLGSTEATNEIEAIELAKKNAPVELGAKFFIENGIERLVFDFEAPVAAAVMERFGYYWLVFDTTENYRLPTELIDSKIFGSHQKVPSEVLVYKLSLLRKSNAVAERLGSRWVVEFDSQLEYEIDKPLQVFENNEYVSVKATEAGDVVVINDEFYGEKLNIVPILGSGEGVPKRISRNDVIFDPTIQGVVFREVRELADVNTNKNGIRIAKNNVETKVVVKNDKEPIYEFRNWPQLSADALSTVKRNMLGKSRFDYGALLFTQRMYGEAAINLQGLKGYKADFLYAAAEFMNGRYDKALVGFNRVNLPAEFNENELLMWQIASNYRLKQTAIEKAQEVEFTEEFQLPDNIKQYPDNISAELLLALAEKKIEEDDLEAAQNFINEMPKRARVEQYNYKNYLQARIDDQQGKRARAREVWAALSDKIQDRLVRAKATVSAIRQDYEMQKISHAQMVDSLNQASIIWRGGEFEYNLLIDIAKNSADIGMDRMALRRYKEAITHFPDHPGNEDVIKEMQKIYKSSILSSFHDKNRTFEVVATYYEFEELKPSGDAGEQITLELAEKLVEFDLLQEAIDVLAGYSRKIADPEERALVMTRLAILEFLNNQPEAALNTLAKSEMRYMPEYLKRERDLLLAESLVKAGKEDLAMVALSYLPPEQSNRLKVQILWKNKEWEEMIKVYSDIVQKDDADILKIAVANTILGNEDELKEMQSLYWNQVKDGPLAESFTFVTNTQDVDYRNLTESLRIDLVKDVVDSYRNKLKLGGYEEAKLN